jgi:alpha-L-fucosidase
MTDARIFRTVHLPAGHYYFGASFNALYQLGAAYIYVASEPCNTSSITKQSIARLPMSKCAADGKFYGIAFDLTEEQDVVLVFQANLQGGNANQEFRVDEVKLLYSADAEALQQTDITKDKLIQASRFSRVSGQSTTTRYGSPKNWTVENYRIPAGGDGTRNGLDRYPGYDCLSLGVWDDRQNNAQGDLSQARIYRKVALAAGRYYFGAAYEANYQLAQAYIFASSDVVAQTSDIPSQSIAYDAIADAGKDNATFRGIYFELDQPQEVVLGFQADLAAGAAQQEFRASKVTLIDFGMTSGIKEVIENSKSTNSKYIYDLQGRRINPSLIPHHSTIITNHKLVVRSSKK